MLYIHTSSMTCETNQPKHELIYQVFYHNRTQYTVRIIYIYKQNNFDIRVRFNKQIESLYNKHVLLKGINHDVSFIFIHFSRRGIWNKQTPCF